MIDALGLDPQQLKDFCLRWKIEEMGVFGSVLRPDFRSDSDIDLLVRFFPDARVSLSGRLTMIEELERLLGRTVDLVVESTLKNPFRRQEILRTTQVIYRAA